MERFAIIIQPGLEESALTELEYWMNILQKEISNIALLPGLIEFDCEKSLGLYLNCLLKSPTRILMRIKTFRCRDFPKLFRMMAKINWDAYGQAYTPKWEISTIESRLSIKKRIESTSLEAFNKYFKNIEKTFEWTEDLPQQKIFVRLHNDDCTISIDTSGHTAFKRGYRTHTESAPIRESLASALIYQLISNLDNKESENLNLWDPMTGSGCFILEAAKLRHPVPLNHYNFSNWKKIKRTFHLENQKSIFNELLGTDIDEKSIQSAIFNLENLDHENIKSKLKFNVQDYFQGIEPFKGNNYTLIMNPPYFKRIKVQAKKNEFFTKLISRLDQLDHCMLAGIIIPEISGWKSPTLKNWEISKIVKTTNGGIRIFFYIFKRK